MDKIKEERYYIKICKFIQVAIEFSTIIIMTILINLLDEKTSYITSMSIIIAISMIIIHGITDLIKPYINNKNNLKN